MWFKRVENLNLTVTLSAHCSPRNTTADKRNNLDEDRDVVSRLSADTLAKADEIPLISENGITRCVGYSRRTYRGSRDH